MLHFIRPYWLLLIIPLAIICWRFGQQRAQSNAWQAVCDRHLLPHLLIVTNKTPYYWPLILLAIGWLIAVVALAGPAWHKVEQPIYQAQIARVIALDLSASMYASDLPPSRFVRAKFKVIDILKQIKEGQTGMIAFTSQPFVISPLTQDANTIASQIDALDPNIMPIGGADISAALKKSALLIKQAGFTQGQILLITDTAPDNAAFAEAKRLYAENINTSVLGIGTNTNAPMPLPQGGFLKDDAGALRLEKLNVTALAELAQQSGGRYVPFTADDSDVNTLLAASQLNRLNTNELKKSKQAIRLWQDQGCWLLLLLLLLAPFAFRRN